jgi:hypothetical protein
MPELPFSNISGSQKGAEVRGLADLPGTGIGNTLTFMFFHQVPLISCGVVLFIFFDRTCYFATRTNQNSHVVSS